MRGKKYKPNQANTERHKICTCPEGQRMSCSLQMARLENRLLSGHCSWPRSPLCRQQTPHRGFTLSDLFSSLYLGLKFQEPLCCFVLTEFPGSANLQYLSFLTFDLLTVHSSCLPGKLIPWEFWCHYTDFFFHSPRVLIWLYWFFFLFLNRGNLQSARGLWKPEKMYQSIFIFNDCMRVCIHYPID